MMMIDYGHLLYDGSAAVSARYRIRALTIEEPEIEAIVRRIYQEGMRDKSKVESNKY